jgi:hypothetical protein
MNGKIIPFIFMIWHGTQWNAMDREKLLVVGWSWYGRSLMDPIHHSLARSPYGKKWIFPLWNVLSYEQHCLPQHPMMMTMFRLLHLTESLNRTAHVWKGLVCYSVRDEQFPSASESLTASMVSGTRSTTIYALPTHTATSSTKRPESFQAPPLTQWTITEGSHLSEG